MNKCDCTADCGSDPDVFTGKAEPCKEMKKRMDIEKILKHKFGIGDCEEFMRWGSPGICPFCDLSMRVSEEAIVVNIDDGDEILRDLAHFECAKKAIENEN